MANLAITLEPPVSVEKPKNARARVAEFVLVGGATPFLFLFAWLFRKAVGLDASELAVGFLAFHAAFVVNDPHFSVTYLLFYKNAHRRAFGRDVTHAERARYVVAGLVVPIVLVAWAGSALVNHSARNLGFLIQLMFLLVGWHYVKQGFGVLSVLSARSQVFFSKLERRVILAHCFSAWAYAWASPFDPGREVEEKGVIYTTLSHPHGLEIVSGIAFFSSAIAVSWVLVSKWRRERKRPPLSPLVGFFSTLWFWTVYSSVDPLMVYLIPALHSLQYLYFVTLLRRNEAREQEGPPAFGRPVSVRLGILAASALALGFLLFHALPSFLDGTLVLATTTGDLGVTPYFAAIFAFVNIHHYFMDAVIWRRQNPEMRYLKA